VLQQNHTTDAGALWGVGWLSVPPKDLGFPVLPSPDCRTGDLTQLPLSRHSNTWQVGDGLELIRAATPESRWRSPLHATERDPDYYTRGSLSFLGVISGSGISDFLLGFPTFGLQSQSG
jgi:hypothetical protein